MVGKNDNKSSLQQKMLVILLIFGFFQFTFGYIGGQNQLNFGTSSSTATSKKCFPIVQHHGGHYDHGHGHHHHKGGFCDPCCCQPQPQLQQPCPLPPPLPVLPPTPIFPPFPPPTPPGPCCCPPQQQQQSCCCPPSPQPPFPAPLPSPYPCPPIPPPTPPNPVFPPYPFPGPNPCPPTLFTAPQQQPFQVLPEPSLPSASYQVVPPPSIVAIPQALPQPYQQTSGVIPLPQYLTSPQQIGVSSSSRVFPSDYLVKQTLPQVVVPATKPTSVYEGISLPIPPKYSTTIKSEEEKVAVVPNPFDERTTTTNGTGAGSTLSVQPSAFQPVVHPPAEPSPSQTMRPIVKPVPTGFAGIDISQLPQQFPTPTAVGSYQIQPPISQPSLSTSPFQGSMGIEQQQQYLAKLFPTPSIIGIPSGVGGYAQAPPPYAQTPPFSPIPSGSSHYSQFPSPYSPQIACPPYQQYPHQHHHHHQHYPQPPINNCCLRCGQQCRQRKALAKASKIQIGDVLGIDDGKKVEKLPKNEKLKMTNSTILDQEECTDKRLRTILEKNSSKKIDDAREALYRQANDEIGDGFFHVFCSESRMEYLTRTDFFCVGNFVDGSCYIFRT